MQLWRLVKTKYVSTALDGEGSRLYGGRWTSPGTPAIYASDNPALAVLEVLVHLQNGSVLPAYSLIAATVPDALLESLTTSSLPPSWNSSPVPPEVQAIGDAWIRSGRSLGLRVPSAVVQESVNVLVNPAHRQFAQFRIDSIKRFDFDHRLLTKES